MSRKWTECRGSTKKGGLTLCLTMEFLDNSTTLHSLLNITASNHLFLLLTQNIKEFSPSFQRNLVKCLAFNILSAMLRASSHSHMVTGEGLLKSPQIIENESRRAPKLLGVECN